MTDPRFDLGLYSLPEAARLARLPRTTLGNWARGYRYPAVGCLVRARPVIRSTIQEETTLSFINLMEILTLAGFRQIRVPMQRVRKALEYAARYVEAEHLLFCDRSLGRRKVPSRLRQVHPEGFGGVRDDPFVGDLLAGSQRGHRDGVLVHVQTEARNSFHGRPTSVCGSSRGPSAGDPRIFTDGPAVSW